jgi:hypothetical protein
MSDDSKPCTKCKVGWMVADLVRDLKGRWWKVWTCAACGWDERRAA